MSPESRDFSLLPVHFVLLMGGIVFVVVLVSAYGSSDPSILGHSSDEVAYSFSVNFNDCTNGLGWCQVSCPSGEQAISGSCVSSRGFRAVTSGLVDTDSDLEADAWECEEILMQGGGCNFDSICDFIQGENINNCNTSFGGDCSSPVDDAVLIARVVCVPEN